VLLLGVRFLLLLFSVVVEGEYFVVVELLRASVVGWGDSFVELLRASVVVGGEIFVELLRARVLLWGRDFVRARVLLSC